MQYSIKEVSELLHIPTSTIRYYDAQALLPYVSRTQGGYRVFTEEDIHILKTITSLKALGMPLKDIRQFVSWMAQGPQTLPYREKMILAYRHDLEEQVAQSLQRLNLIERLTWFYTCAAEGGPTDIRDYANISPNTPGADEFFFSGTEAHHPDRR